MLMPVLVSSLMPMSSSGIYAKLWMISLVMVICIFFFMRVQVRERREEWENVCSSYNTVCPNFFKMANIKGQCHEIFYSVLFIKQLLLVPSDKPKKDFDFFRIFKKLFVFIIDSPVCPPQLSWDSSLYSSLGSHFGHRGVVLLILRSVPQTLMGLLF